MFETFSRKELKTFLTAPFAEHTFLWTGLFLLLFSFGSSFWFAALRIVDPVHHALTFYGGLPFRCGAGFLVCVALLIYPWRKGWLSVTPAGIFCAAGASLAACFPSFTSLSVSLVLLSSALWLCFDGGDREFGQSKLYVIVPAVLFALVFISGFEQQLNAYNRLIFLFSDWGIYFSGYKKLAEAPFAGLSQWLAIGNHFNPAVNVCMAFIIKLCPRPETLFAVNSFLIAAIVPLLFLLGRVLGLPFALCALSAAVAAFNPMFSNQHTTLFYGYHPIIFLPPFFLLFCIAREKKCRWGMWLAGIFMCGIKETVFVFLAGTAFLSALKKKYLHGAVILLICGAFFCLISFVLLPRFCGDANYFQLFQYNSLGGGVKDLLFAPFLRPAVFWGKFFRVGNISFLLLLLLPCIPAAWFAPRFLLAAVPVTLGVLFKDCYLDRHNVVQWYGIEISVWIMAAMIYGMKAGFEAKRIRAGFLMALLAGSLAGFYFVGKTPWGGTYSAEAVRKSPDVRPLREHLLKVIPPEAPVALSQKWGAQLAHTHKELILDLTSPRADYVLLDFTDSSADMQQMMKVRDKLLQQIGYPVTFLSMRRCQVVVFKIGKGPRQLPFILRGTPESLLPSGMPLKADLPEIRARAVFLPRNRKLLILAAAEGFNKDAALEITAFSGNARQSWSLRWGYGVFPAYMMAPGSSFAVELPLPGTWRQISALQLKVKTFER